MNNGNAVDIIFSDITMPDINGLEAARLLSPHCRFLVFVTGYPDHSLGAFNVRAAGFLLKPVGLLNYNWIHTTSTKHYTYASLSSMAEKLK